MTETLSHIALRRLSGKDATDWYEPFEGVKVSLDEAGCLVIDAPAVCAKTLVTNDIAEIATDGCHFRIQGRRDNVICSGGIKLQIEEIEAHLQPFVNSQFMITKRPDARLGETVVLLAAPKDIETLRTACKEHLTKYEMPRMFIAVDELPYTETGKPARAEAFRIAQQ